MHFWVNEVGVPLVFQEVEGKVGWWMAKVRV